MEVDCQGAGATREVLDGPVDLATVAESIGLRVLVRDDREAQLGEAVATGDGKSIMSTEEVGDSLEPQARPTM